MGYVAAAMFFAAIAIGWWAWDTGADFERNLSANSTLRVKVASGESELKRVKEQAKFSETRAIEAEDKLEASEKQNDSYRAALDRAVSELADTEGEPQICRLDCIEPDLSPSSQ